MIKILVVLLLTINPQVSETLTGIECFPENGIITLNLKMTYNDFIFDYRYTINDDQLFDPSGKLDTTEILVSKYIDRRVKLFEDEHKLIGKITGMTFLDGNLDIGIKYHINGKPKFIRVVNTILTEVRKNQLNLIIFKSGDYEEGVVLTREKTGQTFNLNSF